MPVHDLDSNLSVLEIFPRPRQYIQSACAYFKHLEIDMNENLKTYI